MMQTFLQGDATFDGIFLTAVRTTEVFCRPTCPAKKPRPENVSFYGTSREALQSGYRPCKRCRPLEAAGDTPAWLRPLLADLEQDPSCLRQWLRLFVRFPGGIHRFFGASPTHLEGAEVIRVDRITTPLGPMLVGADTQLCLLEFVDRRMLNVQIERLRRRLGALIELLRNRGQRHLDTLYAPVGDIDTTVGGADGCQSN